MNYKHQQYDNNKLIEKYQWIKNNTKNSTSTFLKIAIVFLTLMLTALTITAQDTICIMITHDERITFDYKTSKVLYREDAHDVSAYIRVDSSEVLCLHLRDLKRRYRDITTSWDDGTHRHDTFKSKDHVYFTPYGLGGIDVEVGPPRKTKQP